MTRRDTVFYKSAFIGFLFVLAILPLVAADLRIVDGVQTVSDIDIAPGEEYMFETENQFQALFETVMFITDTGVDNGAITIRSPKRDFQYPDGVIMMGGVYITQQNTENVNTVRIAFSIPKRILCQQDLEAADVTMWQRDASWHLPEGQVTEDYRYIQFADNETWTQLDTAPVSEDDDAVMYHTTTDIISFSGIVGVGFNQQEDRQVPDGCNNVDKTYLPTDTVTSESEQKSSGFLALLWTKFTALFL